MAQKNKTEAIREVVKKLLSESNGKAYHRNAPKDEAFPYKTYKINTVQLGDEAGRDDGTVIVDIWDYAQKPNRIEKIADEIEKSFDHRHISNSTVMISFYNYLRNLLDDPDKKIQRIQLQIQYKSYYIGE